MTSKIMKTFTIQTMSQQLPNIPLRLFFLSKIALYLILQV